MEGLIARLEQFLPQGCGLALQHIGPIAASPFPDEEALLGNAVARRRKEFRVGRSLAREALVKAGGPAVAIGAHRSGDPVWPESFVGSISHTHKHAGAVAASVTKLAAIGLDLESDEPLAADLRALVCRPGEMVEEPWLLERGIDPGMLRFVAKEACFKAVFPLARRYFEFLDIQIEFDGARDAFQIHVPDGSPAPGIVHDLIGGFAHADGLVAAIAFLPVRLVG